MNANGRDLLTDLFNRNKVAFRIPVYQRNYDWGPKDCERLLEDLRDVIQTGEKHFFGSIIFMETGGDEEVVQNYVIIDGQQRITTTMILLKALHDVAERCHDEGTAGDAADYLFNHNCTEGGRVKLRPIRSDRAQFYALLNEDRSRIEEGGRIWQNYRTCERELQKWVDAGTRPSAILRGLLRLEIVAIELKEGQDDPQVIFETINSTGVKLSPSDLIRNFLLMSDHDQDRLFERYWLPIEQGLTRSADHTDLDLFFAHHITYKTSSPLRDRTIYPAFVKLFREGGYTHETCLRELKDLSEIYRSFIDPSDERYPEKISRTLRSLRTLKQTTCYPFLLHVFEDFERGTIEEETLEKTLRLILTYLIRRGICGIPTNSLRGRFTYLYDQVFKVAENKKRYYEAIDKFLSTNLSRDRMPSDREVRDALLNGDLYRNRVLCLYLLLDIENGDGKEILEADGLTIEHIMPQTLTPEWRRSIPSAEDYEKVLHTLGNLSITGYNSELSNRSFADKKEALREHSKAVILNADVLDKDEWTIRDIEARGRRLADILMERYAVEKIDDPEIEFEYVSHIALDGDPRGKKLVSFTFNGQTYPQNRYITMLLDMIRLLDTKKPEILEQLASESYSTSKSRSKRHIYISRRTTDMIRPVELRDGILVEANLSASAVLHFIDGLMGRYGEDRSQFYISVISDDSDDSMEDSEEE